MSEIVKDMPDAEYFASKAVSNSLLSRMKPTPANCREYMDNPPEPTPAMRFGSALHSLVLEPEIFQQRYVREPDLKKPTSAQLKAKNPSDATVKLIAAWNAFEDSYAGCETVSATDWEKLHLMRHSLFDNKAARSVLKEGEKELSLFWKDDQSNVDMKCRIDNFYNGYVIDLKTTTDASPDAFGKSIANFGYHRQAAIYSDGVRACMHEEPKGFIFVAVEKTAPFLTATYILDADSLEAGHREYRKLLGQYACCIESNSWIGYPERVQELSLPHWYNTGE